MKKFGMTTALLMLGTALTIGAFAQAPKPEKPGKPGVEGRKRGEGRGMMGRRMNQKMMEDLKFTDAQKAKIKTLSESIGKKRTALMENKSLSEQDKRAKMRDIGKEFRDGLDKIMTAEQKKKMEERRKEMRGRFGGQGRPGGPGGLGNGRPGTPPKP
jgi:Spy/CpxP family protein refolding chaperone